MRASSRSSRSVVIATSAPKTRPLQVRVSRRSDAQENHARTEELAEIHRRQAEQHAAPTEERFSPA